MCGIVGYIGSSSAKPILLNALSTLEYRGYDSAGVVLVEEGGLVCEKNVGKISALEHQITGKNYNATEGIAHTRWATHGEPTIVNAHPHLDSTDQIALVHNGIIENYRALKAFLEGQKHQFRTETDTEVLVHLYEQHGPRCVERLNGQFAFALWDRNQRRLFLARDRMGIKPLYYALLPDGHLIFSSELKALLIHPGLPRETDIRAVEDYFAFGYVPEPRTILKHAFKLSPGFTLSCEMGKSLPEPRQYWDIPFVLNSVSDAEAEEGMISRLREAVTGQIMHAEIATESDAPSLDITDLPPMEAHHIDPTTGEDEFALEEAQPARPLRHPRLLRAQRRARGAHAGRVDGRGHATAGGGRIHRRHGRAACLRSRDPGRSDRRCGDQADDPRRDQPAGQVIQQVRMRWRFACLPEVVDRPHQPLSKQPIPDSIHHHAGGQRISSIRNPLRQLHSAALIVWS